MTESASFEGESTLSDWQFPVRIAGAVVLLEKRERDDPVGRLFRALGLSVDRTLAWVRAQQLPFVIAAMGYDSGRVSDEAIRQCHQLTCQIPIVLGPALLSSVQPSASVRSITTEEDRGITSFLFGNRDLRFDTAHAKKVLGVLCTQIEGARTGSSLK